MSQMSKRSTIYFEPVIHSALRVKAAQSHRSVSEIVNEAVKSSLAEDHEDLSAFDDRADEPTRAYHEVLDDLKAHGRI